MEHLKTIKDIEKRAELVKTWNSRIKQMRSKGMYGTKFCRKYGFHGVHLWRAKNSKPLPEWAFINRVENALKKEGV